MTTRKFIVLCATAALACLSVQGQWLNYPDPKTPRTKDGKPNLSAPAPRMNGKPDLSGVWQAERTSITEWVKVGGEGLPLVQVDLNEITKHVINVFWDVKAEDVPLRPEGAAILEERMKSGQEKHTARCLPDSVPAGLLTTEHKMIQTPSEIVVLFSNITTPRQIYLDGRPLPKDPSPSWVGYSTGKWEGDTLVVETTGITDRTWLDGVGHPRSEQMKITERYRRRDFGHMDLEISFDDSVYYTRPFGFKTALNLMPDTDYLEYVCAENEKDRVHTGQ